MNQACVSTYEETFLKLVDKVSEGYLAYDSIASKNPQVGMKSVLR